MSLRPGTQSVVYRAALSASPWTVLEMQSLRHHPTSTELENAILQDFQMIRRYIQPLSEVALKTEAALRVFICGKVLEIFVLMQVVEWNTYKLNQPPSSFS